MTGLLPPAHGVRGNGAFALTSGIPTLAEALKASGRRAAAFIGGFPLVRGFGLSRGYDEYDDAMSKAACVNYDFAERRARDVVIAAQGWMNANAGSVLVWVHLFDPHAPYDPPAEFRTDDLYRDEITAVDAALGALLSTWDARPGDNLVVVTSDHGEAFGEHGEWSHSLFVYDTTLHVPLIIHGAGFGAGTRSPAAVGLTDIGATILEAVGTGGRSARLLVRGTPWRAPRLDATLDRRIESPASRKWASPKSLECRRPENRWKKI